MPSLSISSIGQSGFYWQVTGLSSPFNTTNYKMVAIGYNPLSFEGQSTAPFYVDNANAPPSGSSTSSPLTLMTGYSADTHIVLYAYAQAANNLWYSAGSADFWTYPSTPGSVIGLSGTGGNGFLRLTWGAASGATNYEIDWFPGGGHTVVGAVTSADILGLSNGTPYTLYVTPRRTSGSSGLSTYGSSSYTTATPVNKPTPFSWTNTKSSGSGFNISAEEWNRLASKINEFREYKMGSGHGYGFTTAYSGALYEAYYYRQAVSAINDMTPPTSVPAPHYTGETITASDINRLRDSLNSIP